MFNQYQGIDFKIKLMETKGTKLKMQIWDTAGQDRFESISSTFYKGILQFLDF